METTCVFCVMGSAFLYTCIIHMNMCFIGLRNTVLDYLIEMNEGRKEGIIFPCGKRKWREYNADCISKGFTRANYNPFQIFGCWAFQEKFRMGERCRT